MSDHSENHGLQRVRPATFDLSSWQRCDANLEEPPESAGQVAVRIKVQ